MSANLQTKLDNSLNDVLKTSGFIFEIINSNIKQSNLITGPNNQLIQHNIIQHLTHNINKFDDILDETISKFNDAKWCIATMVENKQKQEEMKIKEELEKQKRDAEAKRLKEEMEAKKRAEEEEAKRLAEIRAQEEARAREEAMAREKEESAKAELAKAELAKEQAKRAEEEKKQQQKLEEEKNFNDFNDFMGFDLNEIPETNREVFNPEDDLDMNNLLGNEESILDGLNMSLLDSGDNNNNQTSNLNDDFDVDNFLNQFGS